MAPKPAYQKLNSEDVDDDIVVTTSTPTTSTATASLSTTQSITETTASTPTPTQALDDAPPPYEPSTDNNESETVQPAQTDDLLNQSPPLYTDIVKLPTYNESQNIDDSEPEDHQGFNRIRFFFVTGDNQEVTEENVGTDIGFILCFLMSFIFNGLGFIVAYCSTSTLSSHYGAFSGFGLSLVKWAFIVKHKEMLKEYFDGNDWLLYCVILLGWMIFLRGMFAYAQLKRSIFSSRARLNPRHNEESIE
ncbi:NEDD4 family-interacting protein 1-like [Clytia hemisphaerica]|uniref:Uncharacterized protein n=1 Tax=Clytia hemisphaerica TaxID=252671 RepID=A0A7M6DNT4_9CNID